jgi:hypothetical protein
MGIWLKPTRINDDVFISTLTPLTVVSITRETRKVRDNGIATFGESIE